MRKLIWLVAPLLLTACSSKAEPPEPLAQHSIDNFAHSICDKHRTIATQVLAEAIANYETTTYRLVPFQTYKWEVREAVGHSVTDDDAAAVGALAASLCPDVVSGYNPSDDRYDLGD